MEQEDCRECGLPITPYKQFIQDDPQICEFCVAANHGLEEENCQIDRT